ncbi:unnamed protein product [Sphagnum troendelagicum]
MRIPQQVFLSLECCIASRLIRRGTVADVSERCLSSLMDLAIVSVRPCSRSSRTRNMRSALTLCLQAPFRRRVQLAGSPASAFSMSHEAHGGSSAAWLSAARQLGQLAVSLMPSCARSLRVTTLSSLSLRLDSLDCYNAPMCFGRIWPDASCPASSSSLTA